MSLSRRGWRALHIPDSLWHISVVLEVTVSTPVSTRFIFSQPQSEGLGRSVLEQVHSPKCAQPGILHALFAEEELLELVDYSLSKVRLPFENSLSCFLHCYLGACSAMKKHNSQLGPSRAQKSLLELKPTLRQMFSPSRKRKILCRVQ